LQDELKQLKKEIARLTEKRDILKKQQRTLPENKNEIRMDKKFSVILMCKLLNVIRSAYYAYSKRS
jgi:hypothetical protein